MIRQSAIAFALLIAVATGLWAFVGRHQRTQSEPMRASLRADLDGGTCAGLRRAQVLGRRLLLADDGDSGARAAVSLAGVMLVVECAEALTEDATEVAGRAGERSESRSDLRSDLEGDERAGGDAIAARALLRIASGWSVEAVREAEAAVSSAPGAPQPLYALGRVRGRAGDLAGASRALEAAMVAGPTFLPARLAWAEIRLDLGDATAAAEALRTLPAMDLRARLLADEVDRARGAREPASATSAPALDAACDESRVGSMLEAAACAWRDATRARLAGDRVRAKVLALAAADRAPADPRLLAQIATLLAELGAVDRAATVLARAERLTAPDTPAMAWARLAVELGRGHAAPGPAAPAPPAPEGPLLRARAALASGGIGALAALDPPASVGLPDLDRAQLDLLTKSPGGAGEPPPTPTDAAGPVAAYVAGLRARLGGDLPDAAEQLSHALSGHGDACRAAGEYTAVLRALKRKPAREVFADLRSENAGCLNLPK